eukprot:Lithocolla_globosa_v1_NODE_4298_length_1469_cov_2.374823.p2 type:complete len:101 gc:universal NODE_4298_length_1469_cov_2.374823:1131-829(-)
MVKKLTLKELFVLVLKMVKLARSTSILFPRDLFFWRLLQTAMLLSLQYKNLLLIIFSISKFESLNPLNLSKLPNRFLLSSILNLVPLLSKEGINGPKTLN